MTALIQISDPHFGTERLDVLEHLVKFVSEQKPQLVVLTGDVTQRARRHQFERARAFVGRLPYPLLCVPGNHDIPLFNLAARWLQPYTRYRRCFGNDLEPEYRSAGFHVVGVNSSTPMRHKDGQLDTGTIERACKRLRESTPDQLRIVAMHHPLLVVTERDRANLAHGYLEAIAAFHAAGVDLVLGGHIHLPYVRAFPFAGERKTRPMWAVQAGTALSTRVRAGQPNSVNIIRHVPSLRAQAVVEQWDHDRESCRFVMVRSVPIPRRSSPDAMRDH